MAAPPVEMPVRFALDGPSSRIYGPPVLAGGAGLRFVSAVAGGVFFSVGAALASDGSGYPVYGAGDGVGATVAWPARTAAAFRGITAAAVYTDEPDGTTVLWRAVISGTDHWWDGTQWLAATDDETHWTPSGAFGAALESLGFSARLLGIKASLRTSREDRSPVVYGLRALVALRPTTISADGTRQADTRDELAAVIAAALKAVHVPDSEELLGSALEDGRVLNYATGIGARYRTVVGVDEVHDLDSDPDMEAPLAGTWNAPGRTFTLSTPVDPGARLHVSLRWTPWAQMAGGDTDFLLVDVERGPMAVVTVAEPTASRHAHARVAVARPGGTVRSVRVPLLEDVAVDVRLIGEYDADVRALHRAVVEWARDTSGALAGAGRMVLLPSTGIRQSIRLLPAAPLVAPRGDLWQTTLRFMADRLPVQFGRGAEQVAISSVQFLPEEG